MPDVSNNKKTPLVDAQNGEGCSTPLLLQLIRFFLCVGVEGCPGAKLSIDLDKSPLDDDIVAEHARTNLIKEGDVVCVKEAMCILHSWWGWKKTMKEYERFRTNDKLSKSTWSLLSPKLKRIQGDLYADLHAKQVRALGSLYVLWVLGLNYEFFFGMHNVFYWIHLFTILPLLITTPMTRSYFLHEHFLRVFYPSVQRLLEELEPRIREDGQQVVLLVEPGSWCPCPEPTKVFLLLQPIHGLQKTVEIMLPMKPPELKAVLQQDSCQAHCLVA